MTKYNGRINSMWICEECVFIFQLHSIRVNVKKKPICPSCGENVDVYTYEGVRHEPEGRTSWNKWTEEELELLKQCLTGHISPHQVAIRIGRSLNSVNKRLVRLRKEAKNNEHAT